VIRFVRLLLASCLVAACGLSPATGDYPIGEPVPCGRVDCRPFIAQAIAWLDASEPAHPAVVGAEAFRPAYRSVDGRPIQVFADAMIVVLGLEDASTRARHVACESGKAEMTCFDASFEEIIGPATEKG
jgi:hypothetical protein